MVSQREMLAYINDLVTYFNLHSHLRSNQAVESAKWHKESAKWVVKTANGDVFRANFLLSGNGPLDTPNVPNFEGIHFTWLDHDPSNFGDSFLGLGSFQGPNFHTACWRHDVDLTGKRVAVVGTGASGVQVIPAIADKVKELHVFQRTPHWLPHFDNEDYPKWKKVNLDDN